MDYIPEELAETLDDFYLLFLNKYDEVVVLIVKLLVLGIGSSFEIEKKISQQFVNFDYDDNLFKHFIEMMSKIFGCTYIIEFSNGGASMFSTPAEEAKVQLGNGKPVAITIGKDDTLRIDYMPEFFSTRGFDINNSPINPANSVQPEVALPEVDRNSMFNDRKNMPLLTKESMSDFLKKAKEEDSPGKSKNKMVLDDHEDFMEDNYLSNHNIYDPLTAYQSELDQKRLLSPLRESDKQRIVFPGQTLSVGQTTTIDHNTPFVTGAPTQFPTEHSYPHSQLLDDNKMSTEDKYRGQTSQVQQPYDLSNYYSNEDAPLNRGKTLIIPAFPNPSPASDTLLSQLPHLANNGNTLSKPIMTDSSDSEDSSDEKLRSKPQGEDEPSIFIKHDLGESIDFMKDSYVAPNLLTDQPLKSRKGDKGHQNYEYYELEPGSPMKPNFSLGDHIRNIIEGPFSRNDEGFSTNHGIERDIQRGAIMDPVKAKHNIHDLSQNSQSDSSHAGIADTFSPHQEIKFIEQDMDGSMMMGGSSLLSHPMTATATQPTLVPNIQLRKLDIIDAQETVQQTPPMLTKTNPLMQPLNLSQQPLSEPRQDSPSRKKTDIKLSEKASMLEAKKRPTASVELLTQMHQTWQKKLEAEGTQPGLTHERSGQFTIPDAKLSSNTTEISAFEPKPNEQKTTSSTDMTSIAKNTTKQTQQLVPIAEKDKEGQTRKRVFIQGSDTERPCRGCSKVDKMTKMYYYDRSFFCEGCYSVVAQRFKSKGVQKCCCCHDKAQRIMVIKFILSNKQVRNEGSLLFTREKRVELYYDYINRFSSMPLKNMSVRAFPFAGL